MEPFFNVNLMLLNTNDSLHWLQARIAKKNIANLTPTNYTSVAPLAALDMNHPTNALNPAAVHLYSSDHTGSTEHIFAEGPTVPPGDVAAPQLSPPQFPPPSATPTLLHTHCPGIGSKNTLLVCNHTYSFLLEISLYQDTWKHIALKLIWDCCQPATRIPDQSRVWFKASLWFSAILVQGSTFKLVHMFAK